MTNTTSPRERAIVIPTAEEVRAILDGTKTQIRSLVKLPAWFTEEYTRFGAHEIGMEVECPHGKPGERLWVRETWAIQAKFGSGAVAIAWRADGEEPRWTPAKRPDGAPFIAGELGAFRWRASTQMPRWASRILLEVVSVRVERLHAITEEDAKAEGARPFFEMFPECLGRDQCLTSGERAADAEHRAGFAVRWDDIYGDRATWKSNPWCWVLTVRRIS